MHVYRIFVLNDTGKHHADFNRCHGTSKREARKAGKEKKESPAMFARGFLFINGFQFENCCCLKIQLEAVVVVVMVGVAFVSLLVTVNPAAKVPWPDGSTTVTNRDPTKA